MNTNTNTEWPTATDIDRMHRNALNSVRSHQAATKRKRKRKIGAAAAVTVALGATAAAIIIPATQEQIQRSAYCYTTASTESDYAQAVGTDQPAFDGTARTAIEMCSLGWANGSLKPGELSRPDPASSAREIPPLGACLRPDGVIGVFPLTTEGNVLTEEQLCSELNLRTVP